MSLERITRAVSSTDLAQRPWADWRDADWLAALGAIGIHGDPLVSALARFMATNNPGDYWEVVETLERRYPRIRPQASKDIQAAVWWYLAPACQVCEGKGHPTAPDAPILLETDCPSCQGTGKASHESKTEVYRDSLARLEAASATCWYAVRKKVA